jgi:hypothetical protein
MKSRTDPIVFDRIYRSDHLNWVFALHSKINQLRSDKEKKEVELKKLEKDAPHLFVPKERDYNRLKIVHLRYAIGANAALVDLIQFEKNHNI